MLTHEEAVHELEMAQSPHTTSKQKQQAFENLITWLTELELDRKRNDDELDEALLDADAESYKREDH